MNNQNDSEMSLNDMKNKIQDAAKEIVNMFDAKERENLGELVRDVGVFERTEVTGDIVKKVQRAIPKYNHQLMLTKCSSTRLVTSNSQAVDYLARKLKETPTKGRYVAPIYCKILKEKGFELSEPEIKQPKLMSRKPQAALEDKDMKVKIETAAK